MTLPLEPDSKLFPRWQYLARRRAVRRMWATLIHVSAEAMDLSQSLARRRHRPSHAKARSTTHRRFHLSSGPCGRARRRARAGKAPGPPRTAVAPAGPPPPTAIGAAHSCRRTRTGPPSSASLPRCKDGIVLSRSGPQVFRSVLLANFGSGSNVGNRSVTHWHEQSHKPAEIRLI